MIIDFTNPQAFDGVITFPDFVFGAPPVQGGGSPGVGGPVIEHIYIRGTNADVTTEIEGIVDDSEANPS